MLKATKERAESASNNTAAYIKRMHALYGIAYVFADGKLLGTEKEEVNENQGANQC